MMKFLANQIDEALFCFSLETVPVIVPREEEIMQVQRTGLKRVNYGEVR
jgi:hypothetical protein